MIKMCCSTPFENALFAASRCLEWIRDAEKRGGRTEVCVRACERRERERERREEKKVRTTAGGRGRRWVTLERDFGEGKKQNGERGGASNEISGDVSMSDIPMQPSYYIYIYI
jgi:hypothetical protein